MNRIIKFILLMIILLIILLFSSCSNGIQGVVKKGDIEQLKSEIQKEKSLIKFRNKDGLTLLHLAVKYGHKELVELLIMEGTEVNEKTFGDRITPLHMAVYGGHYEIVKLLIKKGAKPDIKAWNKESFRNRDLCTPLFIAAKKGFTKIAKLLISKGADVNARSNLKRTPICTAIENGQKELVQFLIASGADLDIKTKHNETLMYFAADSGSRELIEILVEKGIEVNWKNSRGRTPLHYAVSSGHKDAVELMISKGAKVNEKDKFGVTPLHLAALNAYKDNVELLVLNGANVNSLGRWGTPLHYAVYRGHKDIVVFLIGKGAKMSKVQEERNTPIFYAYNYGFMKIFNFLKSLHFAAGKGEFDRVKKLLKKYPSMLNSLDENSRTPLHHAVLNKRIEIVKFLIDIGADLNIKSKDEKIELIQGLVGKVLIPRDGRIKWRKDERTALHLAASKGHKKIVKLLIVGGAELNIKDEMGCTPMYYAFENSHKEVVELLKAHGGIK